MAPILSNLANAKSTANPRLQALYRYQILDSSSEAFFRNVAETTAKIFDTTLGIISFIDSDHVFYKEVVGADFTGACIPLSQSPCSFAVTSDTVTIMDKYPDKNDQSWGAYDVQVQKFGLKFYAGAPIRTSDGHNIGMLALVDKESRIFTDRDKDILMSQAKIVMDELELRLHLLHQSESRFKTIFDQASIGICICSLDGVFQKVNKRLAEIVEYAINELMELNFQNLLDPSGWDLISSNPASNDGVSLERKIITKLGTPKWTRINCSHLRDENGLPKQMIILIEDVDEQKKIEIKRIEQTVQLAALNENLLLKNHQLEEYAQIVSHNLRMPAVNIKMLFEEIEKSDNIDESLSLLGHVKKSSDKILTLLDELSAVLRVKQATSTKRATIQFEEMLAGAIKMFQSQIIDTDIKVVSDFSAAPVIEYPKTYLENIFTNLLSNALKFRHPLRKPEIYFKSYSKKGKILLKVSDNGIGFDSKKHKHQVFKLGKIFHNNADSKGFGLFMIKNQIEAMGGEITVNSNPSIGTIFSINFFKYSN